MSAPQTSDFHHSTCWGISVPCCLSRGAGVMECTGAQHALCRMLMAYDPGMAQAGNRASKAGRYLQWWDSGSECNAVASGWAQGASLHPFPNITHRDFGILRWSCVWDLYFSKRRRGARGTPGHPALREMRGQWGASGPASAAGAQLCCLNKEWKGTCGRESRRRLLQSFFAAADA